MVQDERREFFQYIVKFVQNFYGITSQKTVTFLRGYTNVEANYVLGHKANYKSTATNKEGFHSHDGKYSFKEIVVKEVLVYYNDRCRNFFCFNMERDMEVKVNKSK